MPNEGLLLEREAELTALRRAVDITAGGRGQLIAIEGEAGIGKTALLDAAGRLAAAAGIATLAARAGELERDFGFGVVRQLFEGAVRGKAAQWAFAGQARFAAPVLDVEIDGEPRSKPPLEPVYPAIHGL